jgi:hypothetical protein
MFEHACCYFFPFRLHTKFNEEAYLIRDIICDGTNEHVKFNVPRKRKRLIVTADTKILLQSRMSFNQLRNIRLIRFSD